MSPDGRRTESSVSAAATNKLNLPSPRMCHGHLACVASWAPCWPGSLFRGPRPPRTRFVYPSAVRLPISHLFRFRRLEGLTGKLESGEWDKLIKDLTAEHKKCTRSWFHLSKFVFNAHWDCDNWKYVEQRIIIGTPKRGQIYDMGRWYL